MYSLAELLDLGFEFEIDLECRWQPLSICILRGAAVYDLPNYREIKLWVSKPETRRELYFELFTPLSILPPFNLSMETPALTTLIFEDVMQLIDIAPDWANFAAMDKCNVWYWYSLMPELDNTLQMWQCSCRYEDFKFLPSKSVDWTQSLICLSDMSSCAVSVEPSAGVSVSAPLAVEPVLLAVVDAPASAPLSIEEDVVCLGGSRLLVQEVLEVSSSSALAGSSAEAPASVPLITEPFLPGLDVQTFPVASPAPSLRPLRRRLPTVPLLALALGKSHLRQGVFRIRPPVRRANLCRAGPLCA